MIRLSDNQISKKLSVCHKLKCYYPHAMAFFFAIRCTKFRAMIFFSYVAQCACSVKQFAMKIAQCSTINPSAILSKNNFLFCLSLIYCNNNIRNEDCAVLCKKSNIVQRHDFEVQ